MLIVSELPRLTHLSIDLSRATRAHLGFRCVAFSLTATHRLTMGILRRADSIALWLISDQGQWPKKLQLLIDTGRPRMAPWMARSVMPKNRKTVIGILGISHVGPDHQGRVRSGEAYY